MIKNVHKETSMQGLHGVLSVISIQGDWFIQQTALQQQTVSNNCSIWMNFDVHGAVF